MDCSLPCAILRPLYFLQSGCLVGLQGWLRASWAWWGWDAERPQLPLQSVSSIALLLQIPSTCFQTRRLTPQTQK